MDNRVVSRLWGRQNVGALQQFHFHYQVADAQRWMSSTAVLLLLTIRPTDEWMVSGYGDWIEAYDNDYALIVV